MSESTCSIDGCDRPRLARGWCAAHYGRWKNHGDPLAGGTFRRPKRKRRQCSAHECDRESTVAEFCKMHYQRVKITGSTDPIVRLCSAGDCAKRLFREGFCRTHWARLDQFGDHRIVRECDIEGCPRPAASTTRLWCVMHYTRWIKHGDVGEVASRIWQSPREAAKGLRWCRACQAELPLGDFQREKAVADGYARVCRECRKDLKVAEFYGISGAVYRSLLAEQGGACKICRKAETATHQSGTLRRLGVDHDHRCCPGKKSCGKCIRGLLCARCNSAIGLVDEDPAILLAAIEYLGLRSAPPLGGLAA